MFNGAARRDAEDKFYGENYGTLVRCWSEICKNGACFLGGPVPNFLTNSIFNYVWGPPSSTMATLCRETDS